MNGTERTRQGQTMIQPNLAARIRTAMNQLVTEHNAAREIVTKANPELPSGLSRRLPRYSMFMIQMRRRACLPWPWWRGP
jgi:hypothetical protein